MEKDEQLMFVWYQYLFTKVKLLIKHILPSRTTDLWPLVTSKDMFNVYCETNSDSTKEIAHNTLMLYVAMHSSVNYTVQYS